jgi:ABC-type multidrug transport system fused ATPase/permease subunit
VTVLVVISGGLLLVPALLLGRLSYKNGQLHTSAGNSFFGVVSESIAAAKLILGYGNQMQSYRKFAKEAYVLTRTAIKWVMIRQLPERIFEPIILIIIAISI